MVVLNRNNSEDRLEPKTAIEPGSSLAETLPGAGPRDCLAVRFARTHHRRVGEASLLTCAVCRQVPGEVVCQPLLVGGEVIGSVLTCGPRPSPMPMPRAWRVGHAGGSVWPTSATSPSPRCERRQRTHRPSQQPIRPRYRQTDGGQGDARGEAPVRAPA